MLDQNGAVRPVLGVAASATLGDPILSGVVSLACTARGCLAKTASSLVSTSGGTVDAPSGPAIFGEGHVYFPDAQQLAHWHDGALEAIDFTADGSLLALRPDGDGLDYAVSRSGATWVEHYSFVDHSVEVLGSAIPANAALLLDGVTLLAADDGVHVLRPDGSETIVATTGVTALVRMGSAYVELVTAQGMWALDPATGNVFLLPGVPQ